MDLIEDGKISLLTQPPLTRRPAEDPNTHKMIDPAMSWITTQLKILAATPRVMLENCLESMRRVQANNKDQDLATVVSQEVLSELWRAQFQPAMMDNYRRYVVVTGKKDTCKDSSNLVSVLKHYWIMIFLIMWNSLRLFIWTSLTLRMGCSELLCETERDFLLYCTIRFM